MPSVVQICNMALSHLGAEALVSSINPPDGSVEAGYCATFYGPARVEALEAASWPWALKRVQLAEVTNPSSIWRYAYAKPSDCLTATRVLQLKYVSAANLMWPPTSVYMRYGYYWMLIDDLFNERGSADFEIEGDIILTNEPEAILKYKTDVTDTTQFSGSFSSALSMLLASYLAGPIIKGVEGARIGAQWRQAATQAIRAAAANDANNSSERAEHTPDFMRIRA